MKSKQEYITLSSANTYRMLEYYMEKDNHYLEIELENKIGFVSIENNTNDCDRGNYTVKIFSNSEKFHINEKDMFPRYYFHFESVIKEIDSFLKKRKINCILIRQSKINF